MNAVPEVIDGAFRISLCRDTTPQELDTFLEVLKRDILPKARR